LFVTTPVEEALLAAIEAARGLPGVSVATAVATDALAGLIASAQTPADLVRQTLQGLVPLSREDGRIVDVVAARPGTAPLLRSAFEGVLYYLLEARPETRSLFRTNQRLRQVDGNRVDEVDLVAEAAKIAIEIDGVQHKTWEHTHRDEGKDARLRSLGYEVLRFDARDVATRPSEVWHRVHQALEKRSC
jgi:very-short-patch-repair endonuclease